MFQIFGNLDICGNFDPLKRLKPVLLDKKHDFCTKKKRKPTVRGEGVNPYGQPDRKISFFFTTPLRICTNTENCKEEKTRAFHRLNPISNDLQVIYALLLPISKCHKLCSFWRNFLPQKLRSRNFFMTNIYSARQHQRRKSKHLKGQFWPRVSDVFVYSCPEVSFDPREWRFWLFLPRGQFWPRVSDVFVYSCPKVSFDPAWVTFLFNPAPRSVLTPREWRFCLFLPRGQSWSRVSDVFVYSCPDVSCDPALVTWI